VSSLATDTVGTNQLCHIENDVISSRLSLRTYQPVKFHDIILYIIKYSILNVTNMKHFFK